MITVLTKFDEYCAKPMASSILSNMNTKRHFQQSRGHNSMVGRLTSPVFKIIQTFTPILLTYKFQKDLIKTEAATVMTRSKILNFALFVCVEVLRPNQPNGSCRARSVYLTTRLLGRLSPLSD